MNFRHSCIVVKNLKKELQFYVDILGMKVWKQLVLEGQYPETLLQIPKVKLTYVKLDFNEPYTVKTPPRFELHYYHNPKLRPIKSPAHLSLTVDNIQDTYTKLSSMGVKFLSEPIKAPDSDAKVCFCKDPEGNLIEIVED